MSLILLDQQSCLVESQVENGENVAIHYVVKRTPFRFQLAMSKDAEMDFKSARLECGLVYDLVDHKPVATADGGTPMSFVARPSSDGRTCEIDVRVFTLTTQANGIRFVLEVRLVGKNGKVLTLLSDPMVVVSKQQQIRNKSLEVNGEKEPHHARAKKRARTEDLLGTLEEILNFQAEHKEQLAALTAAVTGKTGASSKRSLASSLVISVPAVPAARATPSLDEAVAQLLVAYRSEGAQRQHKLARLTGDADVGSRDMLREIGFVLSADLSAAHISELNVPLPSDRDLSSRVSPSSEESYPGQDGMDYDPEESHASWTPFQEIDNNF